MKNRFFVIYCLLPFICISVKAQKISFRSLTTEEGLSQNTVLAIAQDVKGFMWFGTRHGLNRYDGYQFVNYINNPEDSSSISNNYISALFYDAAIGLLVGTEEGLNKYDPATNRFNVLPINGHTRNITVYAFTKENDTAAWVACSAGLYLISTPNNTLISAQQAAGIPEFNDIRGIRTLFKSSNGDLWISVPRRLLRIKRQNSSSDTTVFYSDKNNPNSLSDDFVTKIYEDDQNRIWIGTLNGLNL